QEYPDYAAFDGFIIPGSVSSANDNVDWQRRLCVEIQRLYRERRPLLGICFGHQIIAHALGGEVLR
ncbi:unnamed protein product, partial [Phaeothamnion confervicola]